MRHAGTGAQWVLFVCSTSKWSEGQVSPWCSTQAGRGPKLCAQCHALGWGSTVPCTWMRTVSCTWMRTVRKHSVMHLDEDSEEAQCHALGWAQCHALGRGSAWRHAYALAHTQSCRTLGSQAGSACYACARRHRMRTLCLVCLRGCRWPTPQHCPSLVSWSRGAALSFSCCKVGGLKACGKSLPACQSICRTVRRAPHRQLLRGGRREADGLPVALCWVGWGAEGTSWSQSLQK